MKIKHTFTPNIKTEDLCQEDFSVNDIKYEPMLFSADVIFAKNYGGDLTKLALNKIIPKIRNYYRSKNLSIDDIAHQYQIVIDTRVNMLMRGYYPSIPGWHCDDVPRGANGQPNLSQIDDKVQHWMLLFSTPSIEETGVSGTEFIVNPRTYTVDTEYCWNSLDKEAKKDNTKKTRFIKAGEVIRFNQEAIHRASPAASDGWRFFIRVSVTGRQPQNEIRKQVQIYVDINNVGW